MSQSSLIQFSPVSVLSLDYVAAVEKSWFSILLTAKPCLVLNLINKTLDALSNLQKPPANISQAMNYTSLLLQWIKQVKVM